MDKKPHVNLFDSALDNSEESKARFIAEHGQKQADYVQKGVDLATNLTQVAQDAHDSGADLPTLASAAIVFFARVVTEISQGDDARFQQAMEGVNVASRLLYLSRHRPEVLAKLREMAEEAAAKPVPNADA